MASQQQTAGPKSQVTFPPKSILAHTNQILSACEEAELSLSSSHNDQSKFILITELAALLHLGKHDDARHLWHRYRHYDSGGGATITSRHVEMESTLELDNNSDTETIQFEMLWRAVEPLLKSALITPSIPLPNTLTPTTNVTTSPSLSLASGATEYYKRLETNIQTKLEPLATFSRELITSQRLKMVRLLEKIFDSVSIGKVNSSELANYLGFSDEHGNDIEVGPMNDFLTSRNWTISSDDKFWIPAEWSCLEKDGEGGEQEQRSSIGDDEVEVRDKVQFLADIVGFMERQRLSV